LSFTFGLLALYEEEQEILYQHIQSVMSDERIPVMIYCISYLTSCPYIDLMMRQSYKDLNSFTQSMAVINETLRMFPPVNIMPKYSAEDTVLTASNAQGDKQIIPVPKGSNVLVHTPGLHYNRAF
jgi:cytochrome P450